MYVYLHLYSTMDFSVRSIQTLDDKLKNLSDFVVEKLKCKKIDGLAREMITKKNNGVTKEILADVILQMRDFILESQQVSRSAVVKFDEQNSELLSNQKTLIETQKELVLCQKGKLDAVTDAVKSEIKTVKSEIETFSDVVKKNCGTPSITPAKLKQVVNSAINDRSKNLMVFGVEDSKNIIYEHEMINDYEFMRLMLKNFSVQEREMVKVERLGKERSDGSCRPIKVVFRSTESVSKILSKTKELKTWATDPIFDNANFDLRKVFFSPDRTEDERVLRRKLVGEMRERIQQDSSKRYYIRGGKVCVAE